MDQIALDVAHLFAGGLVLVSFMLLYQDRMTGLVNIFALHALVVSLSVAWQANIQQAPHLYITAAIALIVKAIVIPTVLLLLISTVHDVKLQPKPAFVSLQQDLTLAAGLTPRHDGRH